MPANHLYSILIVLCYFNFSCESFTNEDAMIEVRNVEVKKGVDYHSYSNFKTVRTTHLHLDLVIDFSEKQLKGRVDHQISNVGGSDSIIFDTKDLDIEGVEVDGKSADFVMSPSSDLLGTALRVPVSAASKIVSIYYSTSSDAEALMWLQPQQTLGKKFPFLFTQGEAILTRSWIPCQDSPGNRITYTADIKCDSNLMVVMSASNPTEKQVDGMYHFEMNQPIPTYLIAMAAGDIVFQSIGERTGVYAEPEDIAESAYEFADVEKMIEVAEELYGQYEWDRYDILVMPPSFPFGGMENPRLTFATPTIIAGDRSLVSLIAHELAHSWSGNLVTNATWDDFWLNEGFTVYFENRIMEAVYGKERSDILMAVRYLELLDVNGNILAGAHPEDTKLKLDLKGRNPDDGMTRIAYVKGALFLQTIEDLVGRNKFDEFIKGYFAEHKFQTLTTEAFISYLNYFLLDPLNLEFNVNDWVYGKGIPDNAREISSAQFTKIENFVATIDVSVLANDLRLDSMNWTTQEWVHFINKLPENGQVPLMIGIDQLHQLKNCGNAEIMTAWFVKAIKNGYKGVREPMADFLIQIGRRKFLRPIYTELSKNVDDKDFALTVYKEARPNYHSISYNTIDEILGYKE